MKEAERLFRASLPTPLTTKEQAQAFCVAIVTAGMSYHWDDDPAEIERLNVPGRPRLFSDEEVPHIRARVDELFALHDEPHGAVMDEVRRQHRQELAEKFLRSIDQNFPEVDNPGQQTLAREVFASILPYL